MSISIVLAKRQYHGRLKLGYRKIVTIAANETDSDRKMGGEHFAMPEPRGHCNTFEARIRPSRRQKVRRVLCEIATSKQK